MFKRTAPIVAAVVSALLACSMATAARPDHPKKRIHAAKPAAKSATKPTTSEPAVSPRPPGM